MVAPTATAGWFAARSLRRHVDQRRLAGGASYVALPPPPEVDAGGAAASWANLYDLLHRGTWSRLRHGAPHLAFEYRWTGRQFTIGVWVPGTVATYSVAAAARAAWPGLC